MSMRQIADCIQQHFILEAKMTTIGEWIDQQVEEYKDLYQQLEENPVPGATARGIISGEIALRKFQWGQVDLKMWEFFEAQEADKS